MAESQQKKPDGKEDKKPFHVVVAEGLIKQLEAGTAPWQKPWEAGQTGTLPMNPTTGKRYRGINSIQLMMQGREDNRWLTYKQAEAVGAQVRRGERGTLVQYWKFDEERTKTDEQGRPVKGADGEPEKERVRLERPKVFHAVVFNAEQIDGLPPAVKLPQRWDAIERAESILKASGADISHAAGDRAFYRPSTDSITMPYREQFKTADAYYATALHELGHWTGHESRLGRDLANPFGSEAYAKEELRAEIASMIVGDELGIGHDPGQHAAYVKSWVKVLKDDPMEILRAAADAEKIHGFVMAFEQKQVQEQGQAQGQAQQQQPAHPPAFIDTNGLLREWNSADMLATDWQGIAKTSSDGFLLFGQEDGNRTVTALKAKNYREAQQEAELVTALAVGAAVVLDDPALTFSHYQANQGTPTGLADALRNAALTTVHSVTGHEPERFMEVALARLSPVFNMKPEDTEPMNAYLERKGLAQAFALKAESLVENITQQQQQAQQAANHSLAEAREREQQLRTDPNATEDQIMWAKEERKAREFEGMKEDRKQRAAEWTPDQAAAQAAADAKQYQEQPGGIERDYQRDDMALNAAANPHYRAALAKLAPEVLEPQKNDQAQPLAQGQRQYIDVPFKEKDQAKSLGAKWDRAEQSWYIPPGVNPEPFGRWAAKGAEKGTEAPTAAERPESNTKVATGPDNAPTGRVYLAVPYTERMEAKAAGAAWDKAAKSWYVGPNADMAKLERWKPENVKAQQDPAMTPREEFAEALRSMQCVVDGEHPIMDGQRHRIKVVGDTGKEQAGFYVGHSDGHPAGYIKNNRSGEELRWKSTGYSMSDEDKAKMRAEAAEKLAERAAQQERAQGATADRLAKQLASLVPADQPTAYMQAKGITSHAGAFTDAEGQKTYLPATDVDGKVWTMQYIQEDGTKRFAKDSRKEGCFHAVGGLDGLANAPALVIAEGYATAATLAESLGHATVAAFDSGNLKAVAQALHAKYPDKPVIVAGDDDRHLPMTLGNNPGREKAIEAAAAVGGQAIFPVFAPGEASWPADVPAITPDTFKKHQAAVTALEAGGQTPEQEKALKADLLSQAQLDALANLKRHTDFNDLATRSSLGRDGATRQAGAAVSLADERKAEKAELAEQQTLKQKQARGNDADEQQQQEAHRPRKAAKIR
ncbi:MAG: zincin-like metallopeptidase domain-containing protein [Novosphingobium sp.]